MLEMNVSSVAKRDIGAVVCCFLKFPFCQDLIFFLLSDCPQQTKVSSNSKSFSGTGKRGRGGSTSSSKVKRGGKGGKKKSAFAAADDCWWIDWWNLDFIYLTICKTRFSSVGCKLYTTAEHNIHNNFKISCSCSRRAYVMSSCSSCSLFLFIIHL